MPYTFTAAFGDNVILAPCLQQLCREIAASPRWSAMTNLGELGNAQHAAQGYSSDHNPFITHNGKRYVRAIDLGGDPALLLEFRDLLWSKFYVKRDQRVWPFGYFKGPDSNISNWTPDGGGDGYHFNSGDEGHLHISVTQANGYNPGPLGWVSALDSTAPWGIDATTTAPAPAQGENMASSYLVSHGRSVFVADNFTYRPVHGQVDLKQLKDSGLLANGGKVRAYNGAADWAMFTDVHERKH